MVIALCLELLLFFPGLLFKLPKNKVKTDDSKMGYHREENMVRGFFAAIIIFGLAFGIDYFVKIRNPRAYVPM